MLLSRIDFEEECTSCGHTFGRAGAVRTTGWLAVPQRRALWPDSRVRGKMAGHLTGNTYVSEDLWDWLHWPACKQVHRETVHERRVEESSREHMRITHCWTVMPRAKRDKNIGAVTHWEWTHITEKNDKMDCQSSCNTVSEIDVIHLPPSQLQLSLPAICLCFSTSLTFSLPLPSSLFSNFLWKKKEEKMATH